MPLKHRAAPQLRITPAPSIIENPRAEGQDRAGQFPGWSSGLRSQSERPLPWN